MILQIRLILAIYMLKWTLRVVPNCQEGELIADGIKDICNSILAQDVVERAAKVAGL